MATEIDLDTPFNVEDGLESVPKSNPDVSSVTKSDGPIPDFQPMRRKQQMPH